MATGTEQASRSERPLHRDFRAGWVYVFLLYSALAAFFAISLKIQLRRFPVGATPAAAIYTCLLLLFGLWLAPGFAVCRSWLAARLRGVRSSLVAAALFTVPYLAYAAGAGDFRWTAFAKLLVFAVVPFGLFAALPVRHPRRLHWQDIAVLVWLAAPMFSGKMRGIWNVPMNLDFMARLFLVSVGVWAFLVWRGVEDSGFEFQFSRTTLRDSLLNFAAFAVIALPVGLAMRFIVWNPRWRGPWQFVFDFVTIFIFIAVTEELYFRGLLQNLLEGTFGSRYGAQTVASILFGFSHIHHAPFPNWRYVILAAIAGWFYGSAYRKTRSLMASSMTHALVDAVWRTWFTLPRV